ncbi:flotillin family protein [Engelhardtia mirabilis]|uniref:Inner membrane protein YqiK n=1 Tax=Engelhardtia mirabilis TaxID=2528011 RepID=A0A518BFK2_9BACT|nr:Inner membrane protein YqiK [Planctomycetes bacterium Pla133]QDV00077.1 Inner membrane protein YqiK [Planctomycetes bacterium Pla86]
MHTPISSPVLAESLIDPNSVWLLVILAGVIIFAGLVIALASRYKRCPSNKVLVIYGRTTKGSAARTLHGGGAFVIPLVQEYAYLSLDPIQIEIPLDGALSMENIRISVPSVFTVAIGTEQAIMTNAAVRLLGLSTGEIMKQAEDIIFGQLRQVIASMQIQDINRDREQFLSSVQNSLEPELAKIGLVLINVNIKDITDESGYIEAIGRKAAAEAIQQAMIDVADQEKSGAIGVADAQRERAIQVANAEKIRDIGTKEAERERAVRLAELDKDREIGERQAEYQREAAVKDAEREKRIRISEATAKAVEGENANKALVAEANAQLRIREADAYQAAESRQKEAEAAVLEAQYLAQARAAEAQGKKLEAEKRAQLESVARAEKAQTIVDAEANAAKVKIDAEAQAAAIFARLDAEARGQYEIMAKKGDGLKRIVESCGGAPQAFQMLMLEHIEKLSENAAKAISNIEFDKIVVWDGGGKDGKSATSDFLQSLAGSLPPVMNMMRDIGGVDMPEFIGKLRGDGDAEPPVTRSRNAAEDAEADANREAKAEAKPSAGTSTESEQPRKAQD